WASGQADQRPESVAKSLGVLGRPRGRPIPQPVGKCAKVALRAGERRDELRLRKANRLGVPFVRLPDVAVRPDQELLTAHLHPWRGVVTEPRRLAVAQQLVPIAPGLEATTARRVHDRESTGGGEASRRYPRKVG